MYGLFVEHYQQYQTIWNGNGGRTYFYQNEMPYDPPNQAAWMNGSTQGYAAYKVADAVNTHEAWGLGSYCFFNANPSVVAARAFEVPNKAGVRFHNMVTVIARRHRDDQPGHQQHRRPVQLGEQRGERRQLPVARTGRRPAPSRWVRGAGRRPPYGCWVSRNDCAARPSQVTCVSWTPSDEPGTVRHLPLCRLTKR